MRSAGLEVTVARRREGGKRLQPYFGLSVHHMDLEFQVAARYSIFDDRELLRTDGSTLALAAGLDYRLSPELSFSGELFYSPLDVVREPGSRSENDALFNARFLLRWSVR